MKIFIRLLPIVILTLLFCLCCFFTVFGTLNGAREESVSDSKENTNVVYGDTGEYISAEAMIYLSEGYLVIGGDPFCYHTWNEWILVTPSTLTKMGKELRYCGICNGHQYREFGDVHGIGERHLLDVDCILQMPDYPNGCEVVSLATVLRYMNFDITVDRLIDDHLPRGVYPNDDPFKKYLGNPRDLGVGCYAPCVVDTANSYLDSISAYCRATDVSDSTFETYKAYISKGIPVIFWGTIYMDGNPEIFGTIINTDGEEIIWRNHSHCFVMIGYTETTYIFSDPLRGIIEYAKEDVEESHSLVYRQACVIE